MALKALIVVDVQRDFCPGGSLAVNHGDQVIPALNSVIGAFSKARLPLFFTRDWHPPDHRSFKSEGGVWPIHCVKGTRGAEFHPNLLVPAGAVIVSKATTRDFEAYSGFQGTDLEQQLRGQGVKEVVIGGLATDYCVKETAMDALKAGFRVTVLKDCVMGVDLQRDDSSRAMQVLQRLGAQMATSSDVVGTSGAQQ